MIEKLKKLNVFLILLIGLSINSLRDINGAQAAVIIGLLAFMGYSKWLEHIKKPDIAQDIRAELDTMKTTVSGLMIKNSIRPPQTGTQEMKRLF